MADAEQEILFLLGGLLFCVVHYIMSVRGTSMHMFEDGWLPDECLYQHHSNKFTDLHNNWISFQYLTCHS